MATLEEKLHRTWVDLLIAYGHDELSALALDCTIRINEDNYGPYSLSIEIPASSHNVISQNQNYKNILGQCLTFVADGNATDQDGNNLNIDFYIKLKDVEEGWQNIIRSLLANRRSENQGLITSIVRQRNNQSLYTYNGLKYASQSEIRIAQELERQKVLFFPLAVGVRAETGKNYQDQREIDFLICDNGKWGIIEVSYHPYRFEKDSEKDIWFKKSGILCIHHYTAER